MDISTLALSAGQAIVAHPIATATAVGVVVGTVAPPVALIVTGFSPVGPVAGTLAAAAQSAIYGGFTTGIFSALQTAAMAGIGWKVTAGAAAVGGYAFNAAATALMG